MHMFDIRERLVAKIGEIDCKKRKKPSDKDIEWATRNNTSSSKLREQEKKKLRKLEKKQKEPQIERDGDTMKLPTTYKVKHIARSRKNKLRFINDCTFVGLLVWWFDGSYLFYVIGDVYVRRCCDIVVVQVHNHPMFVE